MEEEHIVEDELEENDQEDSEEETYNPEEAYDESPEDISEPEKKEDISINDKNQEIDSKEETNIEDKIVENKWGQELQSYGIHVPDRSEPKEDSAIIESEEDSNPEEYDKSRDLLHQMRGLLTDYPNEIVFRSNTSHLGIAFNAGLMIDLLHYCLYKSKKKEIKILLEEEIKSFQKEGVEDIQSLLIEYNSTISSLKKLLISKNVQTLIVKHKYFYNEKHQFFLLALPKKGKKNMFPGSAHGLSASYAEDYVNEEIEEGKNINEGDAFKIEEGEIKKL